MKRERERERERRKREESKKSGFNPVKAASNQLDRPDDIH